MIEMMKGCSTMGVHLPMDKTAIRKKPVMPFLQGAFLEARFSV